MTPADTSAVWRSAVAAADPGPQLRDEAVPLLQKLGQIVDR